MVDGFNPSEKYESQLGWWTSQLIWENKNVPNQQSLTGMKQPGRCVVHAFLLGLFQLCPMFLLEESIDLWRQSGLKTPRCEELHCSISPKKDKFRYSWCLQKINTVRQSHIVMTMDNTATDLNEVINYTYRIIHEFPISDSMYLISVDFPWFSKIIMLEFSDSVGFFGFLCPFLMDFRLIFIATGWCTLSQGVRPWFSLQQNYGNNNSWSNYR